MTYIVEVVTEQGDRRRERDRVGALLCRLVFTIWGKAIHMERSWSNERAFKGGKELLRCVCRE